MPIARVQMPDGRVAKFDVPEGTTPQQVESFALEGWKNKSADGKQENYYETSPVKDTLVDTAKNVSAGLTSGAAKIGASLMTPVDMVRSVAAGERPMAKSAERREGVKGALTTLGADTESTPFKVGELGAEVAGTGGVPGALAKIPLLAKNAPRLAAAIESGGFKLGSAAPATTLAGKAGEWGLRTTGGAVAGATTAAVVDPSTAPEGAAIGALLPGAVKAAGATGQALRSAVMPKAASPEVAKLAQRAKDLGIDIPADRIANSRPLNALASSLDYVPFSGRAATEGKMFDQFNTAVSRTFGQDSANINAALKKAQSSLGQQFETVLSQNGVKYDEPMVNNLIANLEKSKAELSPHESSIIENMVNQMFDKAKRVGPDLIIDGQTAYNIKKSLDRIGSRNTNESFYARELKRTLMDGLDRALGPQKAAEFSTLRKQYGNMLEVENVAQRGAEGGVSIGRLANTKDINSKDLSELADIAAQFLKGRESTHGAGQRVTLGALAAATTPLGTAPILAGGVVGARLANMALNSKAAKDAALGISGPSKLQMLAPAATPGRTALYDLSSQGSQ